ncbi:MULTISPECIES: hypothetical protein [Pseudomonas]|jgi:hypothetical protein|uniref:Uncharacterized protein n=2 Tax=Pseudomonas TaxID=286 RepID=A0ABS0MPD8_PSELU|nr:MULTISPECIES: hypothetical protein [Pseudomonas]AYN96516.1 hypothetical protein EAW52_22445 [Pseudomonas sp. LTJR-52]MBA1246101.1 hypothetical protein [Pseudomonas zeshuii]MBH3438595.1 hypothetical protein [Pseudomonas luteola]MBW5413639.1 hypothetical protein [Pseudomonas sp. MAG002Y]MDN3235498.1 hypothetical protein [Pseudomonas sp. WAC2]
MSVPEFSDKEILTYTLDVLREQICLYREQVPAPLLNNIEQVLGGPVCKPAEELEQLRFNQWLALHAFDAPLDVHERKWLWKGWLARAKYPESTT